MLQVPVYDYSIVLGGAACTESFWRTLHTASWSVLFMEHRLKESEVHPSYSTSITACFWKTLPTVHAVRHNCHPQIYKWSYSKRFHHQCCIALNRVVIWISRAIHNTELHIIRHSGTVCLCNPLMDIMQHFQCLCTIDFLWKLASSTE